MDSYAKLRDAFSNKGHSLAGGAAFIYGPIIRPFVDLMKTTMALPCCQSAGQAGSGCSLEFSMRFDHKSSRRQEARETIERRAREANFLRTVES
jgi:hypothetical protein